MEPPVRKDHCNIATEQLEDGKERWRQDLQDPIHGAQGVEHSVAAAEVDHAIGSQGSLRLHPPAGFEFPNELARAEGRAGSVMRGWSRRRRDSTC